jgi:hypothetical protein
MDIEELRCEIESIISPERDPEGGLGLLRPHKRLSSVHKLDTSYYSGPIFVRADKAFERLLENESDPLHETLQSYTVPFSLLTASLRLFGDSIIAYHERKERWDLYRFYPPILMTAWAAFESWVRINSEILTAVVPTLPAPAKDALLETRQVIQRNGDIKPQADRRPILERYWLLLKYGCSLEFDRGGRIWQNGERVAKLRDSLVHYNVAEAPSLKASEIWSHLEAVLLLFIAPSAALKRTLLSNQFDLHWTLVELQRFSSEFEERPLHKGWPRDALIFPCPFDAVDDTKYPRPGPPGLFTSAPPSTAPPSATSPPVGT